MNLDNILTKRTWLVAFILKDLKTFQEGFCKNVLIFFLQSAFVLLRYSSCTWQNILVMVLVLLSYTISTMELMLLWSLVPPYSILVIFDRLTNLIEMLGLYNDDQRPLYIIIYIELSRWLLYCILLLKKKGLKNLLIRFIATSCIELRQDVHIYIHQLAG